MKTKEGVIQRDPIAFNKEHPINNVLERPLLKKPKWCDKVIIKFTADFYYEAYVTALNGGDMSDKLEQSMWGDQIELFVIPNRGVPSYMKGVKSFWLEDIGIGKTKEEADATYLKHRWFKRSKQQIQNDRFWSIDMDEQRNKDGYNE
tara:strand:- start:1851 stop:2291 length:441 start_codon:yes stop_codon:yes gene_type:complete